MTSSLLTSLIFVLVMFAGCASQPAPSSYVVQEPSWVMNPNQDGKIGAIGVAAKTYDQKLSTQRKLAITRALDELTLQQGVRVEMNMDKREVLSNDRSTVNVDAKSTYSAASTVTAHIEDVWKNKISDELYIWMVMD